MKKKVHINAWIDTESDAVVQRELVKIRRLAPETSKASIYRLVIAAGIQTMFKSKQAANKKKQGAAS